MDTIAQHSFWLGSYLIDPLEGTVTSGSGDIAHLQKKPMEVLVTIATAQGKIVPTDHIIDVVWVGRSGGDEGLKRCIHTIRRALGDSTKNPRMIRTVRGRGYACIPKVSYGDQETPQLQQSKETENVAPPTALEQNRIITAVSIVLSTGPSPSSGDLIVPIDLMKSYLELLDGIENAHAYELGVMSTVIFGLEKTQKDDQIAAIEFAQAALELTRQGSNLNISIGIATDEITVSTIAQFSKPIALNTKVIRDAAGIAATTKLGAIGLSDLTATLVSSNADTEQLKQLKQSLVNLPDGDETSDTVGKLPELVGREVQFEQLLTSWSRAAAGVGLVVLLTGDAGIGKTALCAQLVERLPAEHSNTITTCRCQPRNSHIPLYPVLDIIHTFLDIDKTREAAEVVRLIDEKLKLIGLSDPVATTVLMEFLQLDIPFKEKTPEPSPSIRRNLLLEIFSRVLNFNLDTPRLLLIEDIHWADPTFLELLEILVEKNPIAGSMILITVRSEVRPAWMNSPHVMHLNLPSLNQAAARQLVKQIDHHSKLQQSSVEQIVDYANGNPLFLSEVTKSALDSENQTTDLKSMLSKPVRQVLLARVDALGQEGETLRYASIIGQQFDSESLCELMAAMPRDVDKNLEKLRNANLIYKVSAYPTTQYAFSHNLLQLAAYEAIPTKNLKAMHFRLAQFMENRAEAADAASLAYHFEAAEKFEQASRYWSQSANRAKINSLFTDAFDKYRKALHALSLMDWSQSRDELELHIRSEFGPVLMGHEGYANEEVKNNYKIAERLANTLAGTGSLFVPQALFGLWSYQVVNGNLHHAKAIGEELLGISESLSSDDLILESCILLGVTLTHLNEPEEAFIYLERALELYDPKAHGEHKYLFGQDPGMAANIYSGIVMTGRDDLEKAEEFFQEGLIIARKSEHPFSLCFALMLSSELLFDYQEYDTALSRAQETKLLAETNGFPLWLASANLLILAISYQRAPNPTLAKDLVEALRQCHQAGNSLTYLHFAAIIISALLDNGSVSLAEVVLQEAKAEVDRRIRSPEAEDIREAEQRLLHHLEQSS